MTRNTLEAMSLDELWNLHKRVVSILEQGLDKEIQKLKHQLEELSRKFGDAPSDIRNVDRIQRSGSVDRIQRSIRNIVIRKFQHRRGQAEVSSLAGSKR